MSKLAISLSVVFILLQARELRAEPLQVLTPQGAKSFTLQALKEKLKVHTVKIQDPVYGKEKVYDAFALDDILALGGAPTDSGGDELVFTAVDGYAPNVSLPLAHKYHPYLAFEEHGRGPGEFEKVRQGKALLSPAPYYLVWAEGKAVAETVPWPYQLVKIELVDFKKKYSAIAPAALKGNASANAGFFLFTAKCIRCHSINLVGGSVGPELNSPLNVTEYWKPEVLPRFIHNAASFRLRSKMPVFTDLSSKQIEQILSYLRVMKAHKIRR